MRCYLNIGNTHTQILTVDDGRRSSRTVATADFSPDMIPDGAEVAAACVVERLFPGLKERGARLATPEAASKFVDFSAVDASTLGQDRIANAVYLTKTAALPAVSIDFGTCITAEVVDARKRFLGGAIIPGRNLVRKALHAYTSKLPLVELADELPPCPGANTADAIRAGTDTAAVDAVAGFLARLEKVLGCRPAVCACGGDRAFFLRAPELAGLADGGDDLTLRGVELIFS
jgi:type III pantothenate kinase